MLKKMIYQPLHACPRRQRCLMLGLAAGRGARCSWPRVRSWRAGCWRVRRYQRWLVAVFRVPGGNIAAQFVAVQGPTPKAIALSGGTGNCRDIGGDGTLVEFGSGKGRLTLHVLSHTEEAD